MIYLYDENGRLAGKFNLKKAIRIALNKEVNATRWQSIYRTAAGNHVLEYSTVWEGEHDSYGRLTEEEAIEYMEKWGYPSENISSYFQNYKPTETY